MHRDKRDAAIPAVFSFCTFYQTLQEEILSKVVIIQLDMFHTGCTISKTNNLKVFKSNS